MLRKIIIALVVVVLLAVVGISAIVMNLGGIVKTGVDRGGSYFLGVDTRLDSASVSLMGGSADLNGLKMNSPQGFRAEQMFALTNGHVSMDVWSVRSDEIHIREIIIDGADFTFELAGGKSNWGTVLDNVKGEPSAEKKDASTESRRMVIDRIVFKNGKVGLGGIPMANQANLPLADITIKDLKTGDGKGLTARQTLGKVLNEVVPAIVEAVKKNLSDEQLKNFYPASEKFIEEGMKPLQEIKKTGENLFKGILNKKQE